MSQIDRSTDLAIDHHQEATDQLLRLTGELDIASARQLQRALDKLQLRPSERIVLDLSRLGFMDSSGLHLLIRARQQAEANGHGFVVCRPTPPVRRLLELVGLETLLLGEE